MRVIGSEAKLLPHEARTGNHRGELTERALAREVLHPAVWRDHEPLRRDDGERAPDALRDALRRLDVARAQVEDAEDDRLSGDVAQHLGVETRLGRLERQVRRAAGGELAQEGIPG